jgi:hypothetical protein
MTQADRVLSTPPTKTPIDRNRRRFLTVAAGASVASIGTLAVAAMPAAAAAPAMPIRDSSPAASVVRAEEIVNLLRTCYVREGWKIDEAAAERALAYCRKCAEDGSDPDDEREAAFDFFRTHGQSLDWIFDGNVGALICRREKFLTRKKHGGCQAS